MKNKIKFISAQFIILAISFLIIIYLIPDFHPFGGMQIRSTPDEVLRDTELLLDKINIKYNKEKLVSTLQSNNDLIRWIQTENHLDKANNLLRDDATAYFWNVTHKSENEKEKNIVVSSNGDNAVKFGSSNIEISLLDNGSLIKFDQEINDSTIGDSLNIDEAKIIIKNFVNLVRSDITLVEDSSSGIQKTASNIFYFDGAETINKLKRVDYNFKWKTRSTGMINYTLNIDLVGKEIKKFEISPIIPEEFKGRDNDVYEIATTIIFMLFLIITVLIFGFKRFRAYEIGFKRAIIFGLFVFVSFVFKELLDFINNVEFSVVIGLAAGAIFIAGAGVILWAVSETVFREIWNDKFLTLDLLFYRKFFHPKIGVSIIQSISSGFALTALFFLLLRATSVYSAVTFYGEGFISQSHITAAIPLLNAFFSVFNSYAILSVSFFMFLTAAIKRFISNDIIFVSVTGLIWGIFTPCNINPLTAGLPVNFIIGIVLSVILIRYDLVSTISSLLLFKLLLKASEFSFLSAPGLTMHWYLFTGISIVLFTAGIIIVLRKDTFTDYDSITPKFVENITERQRMKRELEVARHVQMSFLPKTNPVLDGVDIVSLCIPALEVGGDYYDFINLEKNKLGIIIGDVSGKGTQAAFYMTLTKGFLKALAKQTDSPAEVLARMNELFYENVERGRFISMIYAIIDLNTKKIKIARAGHNPIIFHDSDGRINLINPDGLALGLEKGQLFRKVITEYEGDLAPGKIFVLYTDGFTEAVNKKGDEYGLNRMFTIASENSNLSASQLLDKLTEDVHNFIGKAAQHDDMTMVILKIT